MVDHLLMSIIYILSLILGGGFVWRFWRWWNRVKVTSPIVEGFYSLWGYTYEKVQQPFLEGLDFYITNNSGKAIRLTSIRWEMRQRPIPIFPPNRILYIDLATPVKGLKISPGEVKVVTFSNESLIESIAKPIEEFMKGKLDYSLRKPPSWSRVVVYHSDGKAASKFFPTLRIWSYLIDLATKRKWFVCKYIYNEAKQKGATFDELFSKIKLITGNKLETGNILWHLLREDLEKDRKVPEEWRKRKGELFAMMREWLKRKKHS